MLENGIIVWFCLQLRVGSQIQSDISPLSFWVGLSTLRANAIGHLPPPSNTKAWLHCASKNYWPIAFEYTSEGRSLSLYSLALIGIASDIFLLQETSIGLLLPVDNTLRGRRIYLLFPFCDPAETQCPSRSVVHAVDLLSSQMRMMHVFVYSAWVVLMQRQRWIRLTVLSVRKWWLEPSVEGVLPSWTVHELPPRLHLPLPSSLRRKSRGSHVQ